MSVCARHRPPVSIEILLRDLAACLTKSGLTLGTAESCTGGLISSLCARLPGSSTWFGGGVVAYANRVKEKLLGVPPTLLDMHGAVSLPVARQMALGALDALDVNCSIAVTGIAGPDGGSEEKPVGTVCLAWAISKVNAPCAGHDSIFAPLLTHGLGRIEVEFYGHAELGNAGCAISYLEEKQVLLASQRCHFSGGVPDFLAKECNLEQENACRTGIRQAAAKSGLLGLYELVKFSEDNF